MKTTGKTTVLLPEELVKRLEAVRTGGYPINVSAICREAIETAVYRGEVALGRRKAT